MEFGTFQRGWKTIDLHRLGEHRRLLVDAPDDDALGVDDLAVLDDAQRELGDVDPDVEVAAGPPASSATVPCWRAAWRGSRTSTSLSSARVALPTMPSARVAALLLEGHDGRLQRVVVDASRRSAVGGGSARPSGAGAEQRCCGSARARARAAARSAASRPSRPPLRCASPGTSGAASRTRAAAGAACAGRRRPRRPRRSAR